jgi:hypothetical protein
MINKFLKAKHWQLFLLMVGIPILLQFYFIFTLISEAMNESNLKTPQYFKNFTYLPMLMTVFIIIFCLWIWSIAMGFQNKLLEQVKMKVKRFKWCFIFNLIYLPSYLIMFGFFMHELMSSNSNILIETNGQTIYYITMSVLPLQLFDIFCIVYMLYFTSKTLKSIILQKDVTFSEYVEEFMLLMFYPIGIWILQPKINQLFRDLNE